MSVKADLYRVKTLQELRGGHLHPLRSIAMLLAPGPSSWLCVSFEFRLVNHFWGHGFQNLAEFDVVIKQAFNLDSSAYNA